MFTAVSKSVFPYSVICEKYSQQLALTFDLLLGIGTEQGEVGILPVVRLRLHKTYTNTNMLIILEQCY